MQDDSSKSPSLAEMLTSMPNVGLDSDFEREPASAVGVLPVWVCAECGATRVGNLRGDVTWHQGQCEICGEAKAVTWLRSFGATR